MTEEDTTNVTSVLQYWFDGDQQVNYKTKWFPDGSTELQSQADNAVQTKFGAIFEAAIKGDLQHWTATRRSSLALIIVLDQFSRHICRLKGKAQCESQQRRADELALSVARDFHAAGAEVAQQLSIAEYVFSLMPLRHTATVGNLRFVLDCLQGKEAAEGRAMELLQRFRKQTVRRLQHLEDRERLEATADILEREAFRADESDIMAHPLVRTTEAFLVKHLNLGVVAGMTTEAGKKKSAGGGKDRKGAAGSAGGILEKGGASNKGGGAAPVDESSAPYVTLLISLSGGVDSMVISKILRLLQVHRPQLRIKSVLAMHIDYGNRPESAAEAAYVQRWCAGDGDGDAAEDGDGDGEGKAASADGAGTSRSAMLGGVVCKVRRVDEVTRGVTSRDEYEKVSRDIRYGFYRACMAEEEQEQLVQGSTEGAEQTAGRQAMLLSGVIFGHHLGDVQENVISNVMRGLGPLQLSGMTDCSTTNGVPVWRPLLARTKDEIYDFAHRYGVPYFKDSTPSWSTRGKLRTQLVPLLLDMYGAGCLQNLAQLAAESDATRALVQDNLYGPFMRSVKRYPCGLSVNVLPYRTQPQCFWREALKQVMHSLNMGMVRDSAVGNFVERLQRPTAAVAPGWLELRKGVHTYLTAAGDLVVLADGVLRRGATAVLSSTTLNQRRQQAVSQAAKRSGGEAALLAAQELLSKHCAAMDAAARGVVALMLDPATGILSVEGESGAAALSELGRVEYPHASPSYCEGNVLQLGPWRITCELTDVPDTDYAADTAMRTAESILPGHFSYTLPITHSSALSDRDDGLLPLRVAFQLQGLRSLSEEAELQSEVVAQLRGGAATEVVPAFPTAVLTRVEGMALMPLYLDSLDARVRNGVPLIGLVGASAETIADTQHKVAIPARFARFVYSFA